MRPVLTAISFLVLLSPLVSNAQLEDSIIGLKRAKVQQLLRPYRILDYQRDRVAYGISKSVRQTVVYEEDTCTSFFWAVETAKLSGFVSQLKSAGYAQQSDGAYVKEHIRVTERKLESGKAVLFAAVSTVSPRSLAIEARNRNADDKAFTGRRGDPIMMELPLMQQQVMVDTVPKIKDPTRNWVGGEHTTVKVLGWEK